MNSGRSKRTSLRRWIWRAFATTSLLPLVLVEGVLITTYFITNHSIRDSQIDHLHENAVRDIEASAEQNAQLIQLQLEQIAKAANLFAKSTEFELTEALPPQVATLAVSPDGVRYSENNDGASASFYSNVTPLDQQDMEKVARLANQDFIMKLLKDEDPLITSIYVNTWDSYNRIYPWFDTLAQYPHDMNIPQYNFYYLADKQHNPTRKVAWTEVYLDPAGNGWMMSALAPVYSEQRLEGVVGIDVTVDGILKQIEKLKVPWEGYLMLVSDKFNIMAVPKAGEKDFSVISTENIQAADSKGVERLQPKEFSLADRSDLHTLYTNLRADQKGVIVLTLNERSHLVAWSEIPASGWYLLAVVDEAAVMHETNMLASHYRDIGYLMVAGLIIFYALFFAFMWWRTRALSQQLHSPVLGVSRMMRQIGQGNWQPAESPSKIAELWSMSNQALGMGRQLAEAESTREATQQRLELVMESFAEGLWEYFPHSRRLTLKGALCLRFGFSSNDVPIESMLEKIHAEDRGSFEQFLMNAQGSGGVAIEAEFRIGDSRDGLIWVLCRGRTLDAKLGGLNGAVIACVDITTLKHTQSILSEKTVEAQSASIAKSKFISSISHEFRTPLNAIHGFAQLALMQLPADDSQQSAYLHEIVEASDHLKQLVDDILDLSSLQSDTSGVEIQPINVRIMMQDCADMVEQQVLNAGQTLIVEVIPVDWVVWANNRRLKQVLLNLLSNAIKYNNSGGNITLGALELPGGQRLRLYVTDSGIGISELSRAELFKPFQRLGKENSSIKGTGIGLALCKDLAHSMRGNMGFKSELEAGSCFWIELYSAENPIPAAREATSPVKLPAFLVLSSDAADGELVRDALAGQVEVKLVSTSGQAEQYLNQFHVDGIIIADPHLTTLSLPFIESLSSQQAARNFRVVMMDSSQTSGVKRRLGCQAILTSPLEIDNVRHVVLALLTQGAKLCSPK